MPFFEAILAEVSGIFLATVSKDPSVTIALASWVMVLLTVLLVAEQPVLTGSYQQRLPPAAKTCLLHLWI